MARNLVTTFFIFTLLTLGVLSQIAGKANHKLLTAPMQSRIKSALKADSSSISSNKKVSIISASAGSNIQLRPVRIRKVAEDDSAAEEVESKTNINDMISKNFNNMNGCHFHEDFKDPNRKSKASSKNLKLGRMKK
jgi:hypothetical protein